VDKLYAPVAKKSGVCRQAARKAAVLVVAEPFQRRKNMMNSAFRTALLALLLLGLLTGHFLGNDSRCSCFEGAAIAQTPVSESRSELAQALASGSAENQVPTTGLSAPAVASDAAASGSALASGSAVGPLPKLVDLGAGKCIACKKMAPVLEEAKKLYGGKAEVVFIDVWENPNAGSQYGIRLIPTQIFFDREGKEVFRHEGFFPLEDIKKTFESMGVKLDEK
jgi:thioredoxin 1